MKAKPWVKCLPLDRDGLLKMADLENAITDEMTVVSLMWANYTRSRLLGQPAPPPPAPLWQRVDVGGGRVERLRQFGRVYLALALWRTLEPWMAS